MKISKPLIASGVALAFALPAYAESEAVALPPVQSMNGIKYVEGGIGKDEALAMHKEGRGYPLNLVFSAGPRNHFVSDVRVLIKDGGKTIFEDVAEGPIYLVDLPNGKYSVEAQFRGKTVKQTAQVHGKQPVRLDFHWADVD